MINQEEPEIQNLLNTAKNQVLQLTGKLQPRVYLRSISIITKDPYTAKTYQEALLWRMEEMARVTYEMLERRELAVAATLARACVENAAAMWYLQDLINDCVDKKPIDSGVVHRKLMCLAMGSKNGGEKLKYKAINVMTFVEKLDKVHGGFLYAYNVLSEFAHPNRDGTHTLYAELNINEHYTDFKKNARHNEPIMAYALKTLNISLFIFIEGYEVINSVFSKFTELCELAIKDQHIPL